MNVSIWKLADDRETYGRNAGRFIITLPDGEDEMRRDVFRTALAAEDFAKAKGWTVVPLELDLSPKPPNLEGERLVWTPGQIIITKRPKPPSSGSR